MIAEKNKVNFDMSTLKLSELIRVYEDISGFLQFLGDKKIVQEEKAEDKNE